MGHTGIQDLAQDFTTAIKFSSTSNFQLGAKNSGDGNRAQPYSIAEPKMRILGGNKDSRCRITVISYPITHFPTKKSPEFPVKEFGIS